MSSRLVEADIALDSLYLDPNNPRYADVADRYGPVSEDRVHETQVQETAMSRILNGFEVQELQDSIENIGFLRVDRLVAIELPQSGKYMVSEGNRRLAALKGLMKAEASGEINLAEQVKKSIVSIPVLIIEDDDKESRNRFARVLQGVRHVASVKPWGPYQQAQLVAMMLREGKTVSDIRQVLGLTTNRVNSLRQCYFALEQMREDSVYGAEAKPKLFSHYEEALKKPQVRSWLGWDNQSNLCLNEEHREMFYSWCVGIEEDGQRLPAKIVDAKDSRNLPKLMNDPVQWRRFCEDPRLTVEQSMSSIVSGNERVDWAGILRVNQNVLSQVPAVALSDASEEDIKLIREVKKLCEDLIRFTGNATVE